MATSNTQSPNWQEALIGIIETYGKLLNYRLPGRSSMRVQLYEFKTHE